MPQTHKIVMTSKRWDLAQKALFKLAQHKMKITTSKNITSTLKHLHIILILIFDIFIGKHYTDVIA